MFRAYPLSVGFAVFLFAAPAVAADAVPDFHDGAWSLANPGDPTQFARVPGDKGPGPIMQKPEYAYNNFSREGIRRMADTSNPILKPWAKKLMDMEVNRVYTGMITGAETGIAFVPTSRCWPGGVPGVHLYTGNVYYLQTAKEVWIIQDRAEPRRVYMNVPHSKNPGYSWYGESVGHYENGDTLVVDTIGLDDKGPIDRLVTPHTRQLHVTERMRIVNNGARMNVIFNVDDPGTFTMPFNAMVELEHDSRAKWEEWICNENSDDYWIPGKFELVPSPRTNHLNF